MSSSQAEHAKNCPPPEVLQRVAKGAASTEEEAVVENHLNACGGCQGRFEKILANSEELAELGSVAQESSEADLEAIRAAGVPDFPEVKVREGKVVLPNGLRLALPRHEQYLARLGEYDVVSIIGEGGMGVVLKAQDRKLPRYVALKVMSPKFLFDQVSPERFFKEARSAAALKHPNILTIHAVNPDEDPPFIVMEYIKGKSLAMLIAEEGRLAPIRALKTARQILAALDHAHREGIIHRDVKPANVLLEDDSDQVKLVDFGLARGVADVVRHTAEGSVMGTPWYMSPEQASGKRRHDPRSDLFSVGVVLFEMLVGALPFPGQDVHQVLQRIQAEDVPDPCELNPTIPRGLANIVCRALKKDPVKRYQSAGEFAQAIDDYVATQDKPIEPGGARAAVDVFNESRQAGPGRQETLSRCSACSGIVASRLSVGGFCEVCEAPICSRCWTVRGVRQCRKHSESRPLSDKQPTSEEPDARKQPGVPLSATERPDDQSVAKRPGRRGVTDRPATPNAPQAQIPSTKTAEIQAAEKRPSPEKKLQEKLVRARAEGRPAVSAVEARVAEDTFLRLVENSLQSITEVPDPYRGVSVPIKSWSKAAQRTHRVGRVSSVQQGGSVVPSGTQASASCPRGIDVIYDLRKRSFFGRLRARVIIEVRNLAHLERFSKEAYDDEPVSRIELESLLNATARRAAEQEIWHLLILHSPTGWSAEARDFATGKGARPFRDQLVSVVLFDDESARFLLDEVDERLVPFEEAFSMDLDGATLEKARQFVEAYLEVNNSLSLETIVDELGVSRKAAIRVFKVLAVTDRFDLDVLEEVGMVLSSRE